MNNREKLLKSLEKIPTYRYHLVNDSGDVIEKTNSFWSAVKDAYTMKCMVYDSQRDFWVYDGEKDRLSL